MVRVVGDRQPVRFGLGDLEDYWIDRLEVTNRRIQGVRGSRRIPQTRLLAGTIHRGRRIRIVGEGDREISRCDGTAGAGDVEVWNLRRWTGKSSRGRCELVRGVGVRRVRGKSLPTMYHWYRAAALGRFADILAISNFDGKGPRSRRHAGRCGPVRHLRHGGQREGVVLDRGTATNDPFSAAGWDEPRYMFADYDAKGPFERAADYGFRLMTYIRPLPAPVAGEVRIGTFVADGRNQTPVGDDIFAVYRSLYAYDRAPLNAVIEATEETKTSGQANHHLRCRIRRRAACARISSCPDTCRRLTRRSSFFLAATHSFCDRAGTCRSPPKISWSRAGGRYSIRSTRACTSGTWRKAWGQRPDGIHESHGRDLGRAIDYLETRQDIDRDRLAFYGVSAGADAGVIMTALNRA